MEKGRRGQKLAFLCDQSSEAEIGKEGKDSALEQRNEMLLHVPKAFLAVLASQRGTSYQKTKNQSYWMLLGVDDIV